MGSQGGAAAAIRGSVSAVVDGVIALVWVASVLVAWGRRGRRPLPALAAGLVLAALVAALGVRVERATGGRCWDGAWTAATGLTLVTFGAILHARARAALGSAWSPVTAPGGRLVTHGPYARLRHPTYAGLALMAVGTALAHGSVAVVAAAAGLLGGLAVKARVEDRRLAARFGEPWRRWAADVPAWWPTRLRGRGTPR
jgi:protein-S-isoprenylcysteine O-methyltransferase Ste14